MSARVVVFWLVAFLFSPSLSFAQDDSDQAGTVTRATDGDTLKLAGGLTLKLAAVNAPEIHNTTQLHEEAKRFRKEVWAYRNIGGDAHKVVERFLSRAEGKVRWETGDETFDDHGNLLGYVYIPVDHLEEGVQPDQAVFFARDSGYEIFLNAYLVKMGYAEVASKRPGGTHQNILLKLEEEAKANKLGIWSP